MDSLKIFCFFVLLLISKATFSQEENKRGPCGNGLGLIYIKYGLPFHSYDGLEYKKFEWKNECENTISIVYLNGYEIADSLISKIKWKTRDINSMWNLIKLSYKDENSNNCADTAFYNIYTQITCYVNKDFNMERIDYYLPFNNLPRKKIVSAHIERNFWFKNKDVLRIKVK